MDTRRRVTAGLLGALVGFVVALIVEINFVIAVGPDNGYEASIPEIFDDNQLVGIVSLAILAAGPVIGGIVATRRRPNRG